MNSNNLDELIKEKSKKLFFSYGVRSVSMDDVAKLCGISKKSIYQFFEDKGALVRTIVNDLIQLHERHFKNCENIAKDAIDEVITQDTELLENWIPIRRRFFLDLEKYLPEVWQHLEQYNIKLLDGIIRNLKWGIEEGLYRNDVNVPLIADLRLYQLKNCIQPQFVTTQQWTMKQLAVEFTSFYLHSIITEKGKKMFDNYWRRKGYPDNA